MIGDPNWILMWFWTQNCMAYCFTVKFLGFPKSELYVYICSALHLFCACSTIIWIHVSVFSAHFITDQVTVKSKFKGIRRWGTCHHLAYTIYNSSYESDLTSPLNYMNMWMTLFRMATHLEKRKSQPGKCGQLPWVLFLRQNMQERSSLLCKVWHIEHSRYSYERICEYCSEK